MGVLVKFTRLSIRQRLYNGTKIVNVNTLNKRYPYFHPVPAETCNYSNVQMILGQNAFAAIRTHDRPLLHVAVHLPIGWVLSGPLPTSHKSSQCFKFLYSVDNEGICTSKKMYDIDSCGAIKNVDP